MQRLRETLFAHVDAVLDPETDSQGFGSSSRWRAIWNKASAFFRGRRNEGSPGAAKTDLQTKLQELHHDIDAQIGAEVSLSLLARAGVEGGSGRVWGGLVVVVNCKL